MKNLIDKKIKHLIKHFGFKKNELDEIKKMYSGDFFNPQNSAYLKLLEISKNLCNEYSLINGKLKIKPSLFSVVKTFLRKQKIINLLFPIHKALSGVGENLNVVIGLVDFLGCGFINRDVTFSKNTLVTCENYTIIATKIKIGNDEIEKQNNLIKLGKIIIKHDTWICAGVNIKNNITIGENSVVGAGATVIDSINANSLAVGRPSKIIATIDKNYKSTKSFDFKRTKKQLLVVQNHLKSLGFKHNLKEYNKVLNGENFNSTNLTLGRLYILSHRLCSIYNNNETSKKDKARILKILFPIQGKNFKVGKNLFVDLLGTTIIGNNVTINDNVCLAGNVVLKDNVTLKNDTVLFSSGHSLQPKERRVGFSLTKGLYEYTQSGVIIIEKSVTIGNNSIIVPGAIVNDNVPENSLVTSKKIIPQI